MKQTTIHLGSLNRLRPEFQERYIILHKHAFPGVLRRIKKSNIRNYSIFLLDGILFSYLEYVGNDYAGDMQAIGADRTTQEWWKLTDPMQEPFPQRKEGEWWCGMDLVSQNRGTRRKRDKVRRMCYTAEMNTGADDVLREEFRKEVMGASRHSGGALQNRSIFVGLNRVCAYFEYPAGNSSEIPADPDTLFPTATSREHLVQMLKTSWNPMTEVFHTE